MKPIFTHSLSQKKEARNNPAGPLGRRRKKGKANQAPSGAHSSRSRDWEQGGSSLAQEGLGLGTPGWRGTPANNRMSNLCQEQKTSAE